MGNFFMRIARYGVSGDRNPREDRLTEITAAVLESPHCPGLARHVVLALLRQARAAENRQDSALAANRILGLLDDEACEWSCRISTQVRTLVGDEIRRPDMKLVFDVEDEPWREIQVWLEIKHGTAPHDRQLCSYLDAQRRQGIGTGIVLLVAPRQSYPFPQEELPDSVPQLTWQQLAQSLAAFAAVDPVGRFLVEELHHYLKGEGLVDPERVMPIHHVALTNYREALLAVDAVCNLTAELMSDLWSRTEAPHEYGQSDGGMVQEKDWSYPSQCAGEPPSALATPWNEWGLVWGRFMDSGRLLVEGRPGVPLLYAGVGTDRKGSYAALDEAKRELLQRRRFALIDSRSAKTRNEFIWRMDYPEDVLAGSSLSSQAQSFADWVISAFHDIREVLVDRPVES